MRSDGVFPAIFWGDGTHRPEPAPVRALGLGLEPGHVMSDDQLALGRSLSLGAAGARLRARESQESKTNRNGSAWHSGAFGSTI
jgi:hypothetical protein